MVFLNPRLIYVNQNYSISKKIAHDAVIRSFSFRLSDFAFKHLQVHKLGSDSMYLVNSYHCSRYNTQTGRLTNIMFESVFDKIQDILG